MSRFLTIPGPEGDAFEDDTRATCAIVEGALRIGLNLIFLVPGETGGMETYARELITALREEEPALQLTAFLSKEAARDTAAPWTELPSVVVPVEARRRSEWVRGEQVLLPRLAHRERIDLVHSLASTAPVWGRFRRVVTIHDLIYRVYPEAHTGLRGKAMGVLVPLAVASCGSRPHTFRLNPRRSRPPSPDACRKDRRRSRKGCGSLREPTG